MKASKHIKALLCSAAFAAGVFVADHQFAYAGFEFFPAPQVVEPKPDPVISPLPTMNAPLPEAPVPAVPVIPPQEIKPALQHKDFSAPVPVPAPIAAPIIAPAPVMQTPQPVMTPVQPSAVARSNPAMEMIRNDLARGISASNAMARPHYRSEAPAAPTPVSVTPQHLPTPVIEKPPSVAMPLPSLNESVAPAVVAPEPQTPVAVIRRGQIRDPQMLAPPAPVARAPSMSREDFIAANERPEPVFDRAPRRQRPDQPDMTVDLTNSAPVPVALAAPVAVPTSPLPTFETAPLPAAQPPLELRVQDKKLVKDNISGRKIVKINPFPRTDLVDNNLPAPMAPIDVSMPQERPDRPVAIEDDKMARSSFAPAPIPVTKQVLESFNSSHSSFETVSGFGSDISLVMALQQIVPSEYAYSFSPIVNPGVKVSWNGEKPWNVILNDMLAPLNLRAEIRGKTVHITS